jgi:hypothetical protein
MRRRLRQEFHGFAVWVWRQASSEFAQAVTQAREQVKEERVHLLWLNHPFRGCRPRTGKGNGGKPRFVPAAVYFPQGAPLVAIFPLSDSKPHSNNCLNHCDRLRLRYWPEDVRDRLGLGPWPPRTPACSPAETSISGGPGSAVCQWSTHLKALSSSAGGTKTGLQVWWEHAGNEKIPALSYFELQMVNDRIVSLRRPKDRSKAVIKNDGLRRSN